MGVDRTTNLGRRIPSLEWRHAPFAVVAFALLVFVVAGVNIGALTVVLSQRHAALAHADRDISYLAGILSKQTDRSFQTIDILERNIVARIAGLGLNDSVALRAAENQRSMHDMLQRDKAPIEFVQWLSLIDSRGRIVSTSRSFPAPNVDLSQRDYFRALSVAGGPDSYVSEPVQNLNDSQRSSIYIARRISDPKGAFVGALIASIDVAYFESIYDDFETIRTIHLMREDGVVLASRSSTLPSNVTTIASALRYSQIMQAEGSTVASHAPHIMEGSSTVVAPLEAYPVMVVIQNDPNAILSDWRSEAAFVAGMVLAVDLSAIGAGLLGIHLVRQSRRLNVAERHSARRDVLTGLSNRICFQEALDEALAAVGRVRFGLILIDLDNFKEVNDGQGHQAGDQLLRIVAQRLSACLGPSDMLARLGGDEFAIIQRGIHGPEDCERLANAALETFQTPFSIRERQVTVGASFGIALGRKGDTADLVFDHADTALYQAKALGRGMIRFFSAELQSAKLERKALADDLKDAVQSEALQLYFQPIVDLRSCRLTGFEALLRWHDPKRGPVPPTTFIPIAEETGLIGPLGRWVLREACRRAATWPGDIRVAVNLSAVQIQLCDVAAEVEDALAEAGLAPSRLEIEITESVLLDQPSAEKTLHRLVALGVSISLDDFGTGYSSLSYLCSFPFGRIKIDRSFVARMLDNKEAAAIVQTVRDLASRLGTGVTAEGIESHAQMRRLQEIGCDAGQGYLISRPMPARDVLRFTQTFSHTTPVTDLEMDLSDPVRAKVA